MKTELLVTSLLLAGGLATQGMTRGLFAGIGAVWLLLTTALFFANHQTDKWTLGILWKNSKETLFLLLPTGVIVLLIWLTGHILQILNFKDIPKDPNYPLGQLGYIVGACTQQLLFHWYYYLRLEKLLRTPKQASLWTALAFCLAHFPNPLLMFFTFWGGWFGSWMFRTHRNLFTLMLCHGLIGSAFAAFWPKWIMIVGIGFWKYFLN